MLSLAVNIWIGNAAAVLCGRWGAVTRRAREVGYSRMAIYHHAQRVTQAVVNEQEGGASSEALWAENARLRAENAALWEAWVTAEQLPESKQQAFAVTGSAMGLSLGQILLLLAIILPKGSTPSRATVGRWVAQASRQAGGLLAVLDQCCQRLVLVLCLDEIFFHRAPILMAVEPHSMAWVAGQRGPDRSGPLWRACWARQAAAVSGSSPGKRDARRLRATRTPQRGPSRWDSTCFIPSANSSVSCTASGSGLSGSETPPRRPTTNSPRANSMAATPAAWHSKQGGRGKRPSGAVMRQCKRKVS